MPLGSNPKSPHCQNENSGFFISDRFEKLSFFEESGQSACLPKDVLEYRHGLFDVQESELLLQKLIADTPWKQKAVWMYDGEVLTPRLSAWYADPETYDYTSLRKSAPNTWTKELLLIKSRVEAITEVKFIAYCSTIIEMEATGWLGIAIRKGTGQVPDNCIC